MERYKFCWGKNRRKEHLMKLITSLALTSLAALLLSGCAMMPGGVAASNTPINGRSYTDLGHVDRTDSRVYLLGILPISGANSTQDAINKAIESKNGDALINITVEAYSQYWILFSRYITRVEGNAIRFD